MGIFIVDTGNSRSFPGGLGLPGGTEQSVAAAKLVLVIGSEAAREAASLSQWSNKQAVLVELGTECLGVHTGESRGAESSNVLGFSRFRLGDAEPSKLVELVRQPNSQPTAIQAAQEFFASINLQTALCNDFAGRIVDRLIRPYYNAALRRLDEQLATAEDMDTTLRLGLGYPEGPIELLERTGLAAHFSVSQALFDAYGEPAYCPARRARVAAMRSQKQPPSKS